MRGKNCGASRRWWLFTVDAGLTQIEEGAMKSIDDGICGMEGPEHKKRGRAISLRSCRLGLLVRCQWGCLDGWGEEAGTRGWPRNQHHDPRNQHSRVRAHAKFSYRICDEVLTRFTRGSSLVSLPMWELRLRPLTPKMGANGCASKEP